MRCNDPALLEDPYPFYAELRRSAPVWPVPGTDAFFVSSWVLVTDALARPEDFSSHLTSLLIQGEDGELRRFDMRGVGTAPDVLATADDPDHAAQRGLVQPLLKASRLEALQPWLEDRAAELLAQLAGKPRIEWAGGFANLLPMQVVARLIGLPAADVPKLVQWAFEGTELLSGIATLARMAELGREAAACAVYLTEQLELARSRPADDVLGALIAGARAGAIAESAIVPMLVQLTGAGGESTAGLIGNAVRLLAERPELQQELRAEPFHVDAFLEEALRLESPFRGHYRVATRDAELGGVAIPKQSLLLLLWASANRDPAAIDRKSVV